MADSRDDVPIMGQGLTWESMTPAVMVLPYGLTAESQSHDTGESRAMPEKFRSRKG